MTIEFTREELEILENALFTITAKYSFKSIPRGSNPEINLRTKISNLVLRELDKETEGK